MKYFYLVLFIAFFHLSLISQDIPVLRLELNARMTEDTYTLIPCGEEGVVIFYEGGTSTDGQRSWHFALFGTQLEEKWVMDTLMDDGLRYSGHFLHGSDLTLLFYNEGRTGKDIDNLQIVKMGLRTGTITTFKAGIPDKSIIGGFAVSGYTAIVGFTEKRIQANFLLVNLLSGATFVRSVDIEGQTFAGNIIADSSNSFMYAMVESYESKRQARTYVVKIGEEGKIYDILEIKPVLDDKYINSAYPVMDGNELFVAGTYSWFPNEISIDLAEDYPESAGVFIAGFQDGVQTFIHFYNFLEFENLYKSMSGKDVVRIRKKAEKQQKRGEEVSLDYKVLLHPVRRNDNELLVACEAFYPEYRTVTDMYYDYYGRMVPQTYTVFDGYKYFAGIVVAFDRNGKLLWDNEMAIWDMQTFDLQRYLNLYVDGEDKILFYNRNGKIEYMVFNGNETIDDNEDLEIRLKHENDRLLDDARSRIVHWYDNFFLCYGYQEIRNNRLSNNRRMVFYVNKVALQ